MVSKDAAAPETQADTPREVARTTRTFDSEALRSMTTLDDALRALQGAGITVKDATDYIGDGFELLDDDEKKQLVGLAFVVLEGTQSDGDFGKFTSLRIMTKDGRKVILNDGSTGIHAQVSDFLGHNDSIAGLYVPNGLRASEYMFCDSCRNIERHGTSACSKCGNSPLKPASTFYLDTSK